MSVMYLLMKCELTKQKSCGKYITVTLCVSIANHQWVCVYIHSHWNRHSFFTSALRLDSANLCYLLPIYSQIQCGVFFLDLRWPGFNILMRKKFALVCIYFPNFFNLEIDWDSQVLTKINADVSPVSLLSFPQWWRFQKPRAMQQPGY